MLAPRWAHKPLSGAGAAKHGGRYSPIGVPALYMSQDFATAVAEYEQDLGIRPGILCAYEVHARAVVDLTDPGVRAALGFTEADLAAPWKTVWLVRRERPGTWNLAVRLIEMGVLGIRAPSVRARGDNLVLWRWNEGPECRVEALDPLPDLPRDQRSWR
jgi:RES domain-containing protein